MNEIIVKIDQEVLKGIAHPELFHKYTSNEGELIELRKNTYVVRMQMIDENNETYERNIPFLKEWVEVTPEQIEAFRMNTMFEEAKRMFELSEKYKETEKNELYRGRFQATAKAIILMGWETEWDDFSYENDIATF